MDGGGLCNGGLDGGGGGVRKTGDGENERKGQTKYAGKSELEGLSARTFSGDAWVLAATNGY